MDREEAFTLDETDMRPASRHLCPDCGSAHVITDVRSGERICGECGLVLEDMLMDDGPEYRSFSLEENLSRERVGAPNTSLMPLGSTFDIRTMDLNDQEAVSKFIRLKKQDSRSNLDGYRRNFSQAFTEIDRLTSLLHSGAFLKEYASLIYRKAFEVGYVRGRTINGVTAASLYAAYRMRDVPLHLEALAKVSYCDEAEIRKTYRGLHWELKLNPPNPDARKIVPKLAERLEVSPMLQNFAVSTLTLYNDMGGTAGRDPYGLVAAALYKCCVFASEEEGDRALAKTQKEIAAEARVTEVTIRNRYKSLEEKIDDDTFRTLYNEIMR